MIIQYISNLTIPLLLFYVLGYGLFCKVDIFDAFVDGVKDGFRVVAGVLPTLIGLMIAIGILRASGILEGIASVAAPWTEKVFLPAALLPLSLIKMISSSAATGLLLDIYKECAARKRFFIQYRYILWQPGIKTINRSPECGGHWQEHCFARLPGWQQVSYLLAFCCSNSCRAKCWFCTFWITENCCCVA